MRFKVAAVAVDERGNETPAVLEFYAPGLECRTLDDGTQHVKAAGENFRAMFDARPPFFAFESCRRKYDEEMAEALGSPPIGDAKGSP